MTTAETVVEEGDSSWLDDVKAQLARKALTTAIETSVVSTTEADDKEEDSTKKGLL